MLAPGFKPNKFYLTEEFKTKLKKTQVDWKFGGLSAFTYYRTYARKKDNGGLETWAECVIRVTEGSFTILKTHATSTFIPWDEEKGQVLAEEFALGIFNFKWTPPGRGLWMMGTDFIYEKGAAALNNCAFISTENIHSEYSRPFAFLMDMSMLGVGVGFDTKGADSLVLLEPLGLPELVIVEDSREGWVEAIACLIDSYMEPASRPIEIDVSLIRAYGEPIKGFGGVASGPEPLVQGFNGIRNILSKRANSDDNRIKSTDIVDIMNLIGKIVVAGNVRRTAELALASVDDVDFTEMKDYNKFPVEIGIKAPDELKIVSQKDYYLYNSDFNSRSVIAKKYINEEWAYKFGGWRWASNNSLFAEIGMDYSKIAKNIAINGEPGLIWLDTMRSYSRLKEKPDYKDKKAQGTNPCSEQTLESYELCCLCENYPANHKDYYEFQRTLKFAYLYAKIVTLVATHWPETNSVITRNRRIGCSQSGILEAMAKFGRRNYLDNFCDKAYNYIQYVDKKYSEWMGIPRSIKTTSVKPSGTVSLVSGALPGIHGAESTAYYRTVRLSTISDLIPLLKNANYRIEPAASDPIRTSVVYFPVLLADNVPCIKDLSIWEQFQNAADMQKYWADNQVSITVTFKQNEINQIARVLECYDNQLKSVSLLPLSEHGYEQAPYIEASREEIKKYMETLLPIDFSILTKEGDNAEANKFCDSTGCEI